MSRSILVSNDREASKAMQTAESMARRRRDLAEQPRLFRRSLCEFILWSAQAAKDLLEIQAIEDRGERLSEPAEAAAQYIEDIIRGVYREKFGSEVGQ